MLIAMIMCGAIAIGGGYLGHRFVKSYAPGGSRHSGVNYAAKWDSIQRVQDSLKALEMMASVETKTDPAKRGPAKTGASHTDPSGNDISKPDTTTVEAAAAEYRPQGRAGAFQWFIIILVFFLVLGVPIVTIRDIMKQGYSRSKSWFWSIASVVLPVLGSVMYVIIVRWLKK